MQTQNKQNKQAIHFVSERRISGEMSPLENKRPLRYAIALFAFLSLGAIFVYALLFGLILTKKDAITDAVSRLGVEQLREESLRTLRESFRQTEIERAALLRYFVNREEIVSFIEDIERAGRHAGVLLRFSFVNIRDTEGVLAVEFETLGDFSETFYFLQIIEYMPMKISLEKFLLSKEVPRSFEKRKESDEWHAIFTLGVLSFENQ
jgi:hypothetical protein